jgi:glycosyltransferase involved in cell wall biosynthesis
MPEKRRAQPLITIAIPTFNRATQLQELLEVLLPQIAAYPEIDLYISDNASSDQTEPVVRSFLEGGASIRYERQPVNVGPDCNFVKCFRQARGKYFWMCGDDDIICPGTIDKVLRQIGGGQEVDLLYLTSYAFREDWAAERTEDTLGRQFHVFTSALEFAKVTNIMFTFISGMIVNRERLLLVPHEDPSAFLNTNLIQLSWSLPLLLHHRRSVVIWDRCLAAQTGNAGGYSLGKVFGEQLKCCVGRLLPERSDLQDAILNFTLRRWLPSVIYALRRSKNERIGIATVNEDVGRVYGDNPRYWLFTYPVMQLPLPLARVWLKAGTLVSALIYVLTIPRFWRKEG